MPQRGHPCDFTPAAIANMRQRYEDSDEPQSSIAADFATHRQTLNKLAKKHGWTLRKHRAPRDLPPDMVLLAEAEQAVRASGGKGLFAIIAKEVNGRDMRGQLIDKIAGKQ
jgi:hypothetical protein